jgi:hypothetical protein
MAVHGLDEELECRVVLTRNQCGPEEEVLVAFGEVEGSLPLNQSRPPTLLIPAVFWHPS